MAVHTPVYSEKIILEVPIGLSFQGLLSLLAKEKFLTRL